MSPIPAVTLLVPAPLRACCAGAAELPVSASPVLELLDGLARTHPALYRSVCDETGTLRRHLNVFVNADHVRDRDGLQTRLVDGDVITVLPAVSGG